MGNFSRENCPGGMSEMCVRIPWQDYKCPHVEGYDLRYPGYHHTEIDSVRLVTRL